MRRRARHQMSATVALSEKVRELADSGRTSDLVALMLESAPIYAGWRTDQVDRLRTVIFSAFEKRGLPREALPLVLEELESGGNPQTVAAAARALRNSKVLPVAASGLLIRAINRFVHEDDMIESSNVDGQEPTTLLSELLRTLIRLSPSAPAESFAALQSVADRNIDSISAFVRADLDRALRSLAASRPKSDCCCSTEIAAWENPQVGNGPRVAPTGALLQDQDGEHTTFGSFFSGRPSVITFFYTRCMVPQKCSLTITKLARLQQTIASSDLRDRVNIAAITYDPQYDLPSRLRSYGLDRGMTFDRQGRLLRAPREFEVLRNYFDLQVGFGPVTVNRHRIELFVLDRACEIAASFTRTQWNEQEILAALRPLQVF